MIRPKRLVTADNRPPGKLVIVASRNGRIVYEREPLKVLEREKAKKEPTKSG